MSQREMQPAPSQTYVGEQLVTTHSDHTFHNMRTMHNIPDYFLSSFKFSKLQKAGGKGGRPMAFTDDKRFLIKEITPDDHLSLLLHTPVIFERAAQADSLIAPIFLHFSANGKYYICMRNVLPATNGTIWHKRYDLKGNRDDKLMEDEGDDVVEVHKRCFAIHTCWYGCDTIPLCNTPSRQKYYRGKKHAFSCEFTMTPSQSLRIKDSLVRDADVFARAGTMDYSLIVGIVRQGTTDPVPPPDGLKQFVVNANGWTYIYYLGIIDYLQEWTAVKKIAAVIKAPFAPKPLSTVPPPKYAEQFKDRLCAKFVGDGGATLRI